MNLGRAAAELVPEPVEQALDDTTFAHLFLLQFTLQLCGKLVKLDECHPCAIDQHPIATEVAQFSRCTAVQRLVYFHIASHCFLRVHNILRLLRGYIEVRLCLPLYYMINHF